MPLSLRARLTAWYSVLVVCSVGLFMVAVLLLHWRLQIDQFDRSLEAIANNARNVFVEETGEVGDVQSAAVETAELIHPDDAVVAVLDDGGRPLTSTERLPPLPERPLAIGTHTVKEPTGRSWRATVLLSEVKGTRYVIAVGAPLDRPLGEWRRLLKASFIGLPVVLLAAISAGLFLGRHGLRPLATMADEAQSITPATPDRRVAVPPGSEELERLARAFNRVLDRLGSALSTQRRFMADASHELRTPVSIMRTAADVTLARDHRDEREYREALTAIAQQGTRLARLVDDMLVLARADAGGYPIVRTEVDLDAVVGDCLREFGGSAAAKNIRVKARLEPVSVTADEALLRRMFGNLVGNALAYTPAGGTVDVTMTPEKDAVVVRIADTGPGIPDEERDRVFERFVRLDPARPDGGAGLGLSIARWIAEAHGGRIDLRRNTPTGSVFSATLPMTMIGEPWET